MARERATMTIPSIATARLLLRAFTDEDDAPLHRVMADRDVMRYFPRPDPPTREQIQRLIAAQLKHWEEHGFGWWAVQLASTAELIGWSGLQFLSETDETEVAYLLGRRYWGRGLATEAARAGLSFAFETLGLERIVAIVHPENVASRRVIEKLGMVFVNRACYFGMDCCRYALDRSAYHPLPADTVQEAR
jgi:ribosomal-protein-alanine N-acetyltransferase